MEQSEKYHLGPEVTAILKKMDVKLISSLSNQDRYINWRDGFTQMVKDGGPESFDRSKIPPAEEKSDECANPDDQCNGEPEDVVEKSTDENGNTKEFNLALFSRLKSLHTDAVSQVQLLEMMVHEMTEQGCEVVAEETGKEGTFVKEEMLLKRLKDARNQVVRCFTTALPKKISKQLLQHFRIWSNVYINQVGAKNVDLKSREVTIQGILDSKLQEMSKSLDKNCTLSWTTVEEVEKELKKGTELETKTVQLLGPEWVNRLEQLRKIKANQAFTCIQKMKAFKEILNDYFDDNMLPKISYKKLSVIAGKEKQVLDGCLNELKEIKSFVHAVSSVVKGIYNAFVQMALTEQMNVFQANEHASDTYIDEMQRIVGDVTDVSQEIFEKHHEQVFKLIEASFYSVPNFTYSKVWRLDLDQEVHFRDRWATECGLQRNKQQKNPSGLDGYNDPNGLPRAELRSEETEIMSPSSPTDGINPEPDPWSRSGPNATFVPRSQPNAIPASPSRNVTNMRTPPTPPCNKDRTLSPKSVYRRSVSPPGWSSCSGTPRNRPCSPPSVRFSKRISPGISNRSLSPRGRSPPLRKYNRSPSPARHSPPSRRFNSPNFSPRRRSPQARIYNRSMSPRKYGRSPSPKLASTRRSRSPLRRSRPSPSKSPSRRIRSSKSRSHSPVKSNREHISLFITGKEVIVEIKVENCSHKLDCASMIFVGITDEGTPYLADTKKQSIYSVSVYDIIMEREKDRVIRPFKFDGKIQNLYTEEILAAYFSRIKSNIERHWRRKLKDETVAVALPSITPSYGRYRLKTALYLAGFHKSMLVQVTTAMAVTSAPYFVDHTDFLVLYVRDRLIEVALIQMISKTKCRTAATWTSQKLRRIEESEYDLLMKLATQGIKYVCTGRTPMRTIRKCVLSVDTSSTKNNRVGLIWQGLRQCLPDRLELVPKPIESTVLPGLERISVAGPEARNSIYHEVFPYNLEIEAGPQSDILAQLNTPAVRKSAKFTVSKFESNTVNLVKSLGLVDPKCEASITGILAVGKEHPDMTVEFTQEPEGLLRINFSDSVEGLAIVNENHMPIGSEQMGEAVKRVETIVLTGWAQKKRHYLDQNGRNTSNHLYSAKPGNSGRKFPKRFKPAT